MATIDELYQQYLLSQQPSLGGLPTTLTPYQRIMGQMTPTMNPYTGAGVAIGGYDPALYRRMSGSGLINLGQGGSGGMGGGGGGDSYSPSGPPPTTTTEEFAAQSARNQQINDFLSSIAKNSLTGLVFSGLNTMFGTQAPAPVDSLGTSLGGGFGSPAAQGQTSSQSGEGNPGEQGGFTSYDTGVGNPGESDSGGYGGYGGTSSDTGSGNPGESGSSDSSSGGGDGTSSGAGTDSGGDGWAMGGKVTKSRLKGPNPKGPDEGYGALLSGEYVIKKSAVKKYGQGLLDMINDGKIPAKKMKSLLG